MLIAGGGGGGEGDPNWPPGWVDTLIDMYIQFNPIHVHVDLVTISIVQAVWIIAHWLILCISLAGQPPLLQEGGCESLASKTNVHVAELINHEITFWWQNTVETGC